ncbi:MAG: hypothetical protein R3C56_20490 [Pirellulaceae bacterium]
MTTPTPPNKSSTPPRAGLRLTRASELVEKHDDSVGALLSYDDTCGSSIGAEFIAGYYDPCFSIVRSWEDKELHAKAIELYEQWRAWQAE